VPHILFDNRISNDHLLSMLAEERRLRIREILSQQRTVTGVELTESLGVTSATIRRDLATLETEGGSSALARGRGLSHLQYQLSGIL